MGKEIIFYYDVICPYAYLASKLIGDVAKRNNAILKWRPVLLGGIYKSTKKEGSVVPDNKMILTYADQKRKIMGQDLAMQFARYNLPINQESVPHHIRTINALRLILSTNDETSPVRVSLTHSLYDALWLDRKDISQIDVLQEIVDSIGYQINVEDYLNDEANDARPRLHRNTEEAVERGGFGVPGFWVNNRLYFGGDRLFLVEQALGKADARPHRLIPNQRQSKLTVYFDFASPWSFLGLKQLPSLLKSLEPAKVDVEYVPILLGALFTAIGTPVVPAAAMGTNKRNYYQQDLMDWLKYHGINDFKMSSHFPIRTVLPLRVALAKPEYKLIEAIYDAAWRFDKDISNEQVLREILNKNGYDGESLIQQTKSNHVKELLKKNNERALNVGVCGVPSFQVNDEMIVFGQDRLNVVSDMILGWQYYGPLPKNKL